MIADKACAERGCPMYDSREDEGVQMVPAQQQEPFGYFRYDLRLDAWVQNREGRPGTPFYTSPPASKPWVGLTHDEVDSWELPDCPTVFEFAQFIEAKLKEKNA